MSSQTYNTTSVPSFIFGLSSDCLISFYNATPVAKQTVASYAGDTITSSSPWGFSSAAKANELIAEVEALRTALVNLGLIQ